MTALALLLPAAQDSSASNVAQLAKRLAVDTQRLGDARGELEDTRAELRSVRSEHRRLRAEVEARLVAIYMHGSDAGALTRVVGGESLRDVGITMDALDQVAEHDARLLHRWQQLDRRRTRLLRERHRLESEVRALEARVQGARERLSAAEHVAAEARRQAGEMARIEDSPLLPKVGHPETVAVEAAEGVSAPVQPIGFVQSGTASFYDDSFAGEKTANGETYDPGAFTAAHPSLPFGTWVTVHGPTGAVSVRINDRGPFVGGRIIDLSRAAAEAIGLSLGEVTISVAA
jgi:hypothetical protein